MFCHQCEQTASVYGCTEIGVCGKESDVAALQDLLIYQLQGISYYAQQLINKGTEIDEEIQQFMVKALFSTLTNVNFDIPFFITTLQKSQQIKLNLQQKVGALTNNLPSQATYLLPSNPFEIEKCAETINIRPQAETEPDIQSLKDTLLYGIKGMSAYVHQAWALGYYKSEINTYFFKGLSLLLDNTLTVTQLVGYLMEFGQVNFKCMAELSEANTTTYQHPQPTPVAINKKKGPFIIVSGHDLLDLQQLLEQTEGKGINIYTHGEMLPAHGYPGLKKYTHLSGNYGGGWQMQQHDFRDLPGAVLMTTNCLIKPGHTYSDRIFTTNVVGWPNIPHIKTVNGVKDFSPLINKALELGGWSEDEEEKNILTGFGHNAILSHAPKIVEAVKSGQIRHFFLVGGCDGAKPGRNYYTVFTEKAPQDTVILTLACGKYRFNKNEFGTVAGLPRLMDMGQCSDAYSAIAVVTALAEAFECGINELPVTLVLSWFEQKAVSILLTLLSLGVKNIYLGPTLPAFITPNVLNLLVKEFNLMPISTPEQDMAKALNLN